jgi:hypothetical protein
MEQTKSSTFLQNKAQLKDLKLAKKNAAFTFTTNVPCLGKVCTDFSTEKLTPASHLNIIERPAGDLFNNIPTTY